MICRVVRSHRRASWVLVRANSNHNAPRSGVPRVPSLMLSPLPLASPLTTAPCAYREERRRPACPVFVRLYVTRANLAPRIAHRARGASGAFAGGAAGILAGILVGILVGIS